MKRRSVLSILTLAMLTVAACSKEEAAAPKAPVAGAPAAPAAEGQLAKIPILPGYKYYVGGPVMKKDAYGKFRLSGFNGEVQQPPSRGMIFGAKTDGDQLEYRVWGNGVLLGLHRGVMRGGVFWQTYAEGYRQGVLIARETIVNDDETKRSKVTTQDLDPENGEVIRTREASLSYLPPADLEDDEDPDENDEDEGGEGNMIPVPGVKKAAPAAPAEGAKDAAK